MKYKRILIFFCIIAILAAPNALANASAYLEQLELFNQLTGNNYAKDYTLTREDFCVAISKMFFEDRNENVELPFADAGQLSPQSRKALSELYASGILRGVQENGRLYMRPDLPITRQEAVTLLGRVLSKSSETRMEFTDEASIQPYAYGHIAWFAENGIILGYPDGSFGPANNMTAGELASLTMRAFDWVRISRIAIETVSGTGNRGHTDGGRQEARFTLPYGILCGSDGKITVFDTYSSAIRTIHSGIVETITGKTDFFDDNGFSKGYYLDDTLDKALLNRPSDGAYNTKGELFFSDSANHVIRHIKGNTVYTFCGTTAGFKDGARNVAQFNNPMAIAMDQNDNLYVADTLNHCIRKISPDGNVTTLAGQLAEEGYRDGGARDALFRAPAGIAVCDDGSIVYVSGTGNHRLRKIENGQVTTIAGTADKTDEGDPLGGFKNGAARDAMFNLPRGIHIVDGVLMVADSGNHMIRAITESGNVVTIAGNGEPGDVDGSCLEAVLNSPSGLGHYEGQLYIADTGNNKIKKMVFDPSLYR